MKKRELNILFATYPWAFECPGGGEMQLLKTFAALQRRGSIHVDYFDMWKPRLKDCDGVHFFSVQKGSAGFLEYVRSVGVKIYLSPIYWPSPQFQRGDAWEIEKMLNLADVVLPNTEAEKKWLASTFDISPEKFQVVPNGIDTHVFKESEPLTEDDKKLLGEFKAPFFLCLGNIEPRKNQKAVLDALKRLGNTSQKLVCLGHIRDQEYFRQLRQYESFVYFGYREQRSALFQELCRRCTAMVLPSWFETPGLAALEAGYLGANIVITEVGGTREYFGSEAIYLEPSSISSIETALTQALQQPRSTVLRERVAQMYTWDRVAEILSFIYEGTWK